MIPVAVLLMAFTANVGPDDCVEYPTGRDCGAVFSISVAVYVLAGLAILATLGLLALRIAQRVRARR